MGLDERTGALHELQNILPELRGATGFTPNSYRALERLFGILDHSVISALESNSKYGFIGYLASVKMAEDLILKYRTRR